MSEKSRSDPDPLTIEKTTASESAAEKKSAGPNFISDAHAVTGTDGDRSGSVELPLRLESASGTEHRVDLAHDGDVWADSPPDISSTPAKEAAASGESIEQQPSIRPIPRISRQQKELLLQASQIAEQLQDQENELDRRELALNEHRAALDQDRRNLRLRVHQFEQEMLDHEEELCIKQADFENKFTACEKFVAELEHQEQQLAQVRQELEVERGHLKLHAERELQVERAALKQTQRGLEAERRQLHNQIQQNDQEHEAALQDIRRKLENERKELWQNLTNELERERTEQKRERTEQKRERDEWLAQHDAKMSEIQNERELTEAAVRRSQDELQQQKIERERQLADERQLFEQECEADRRQLQQQRTVLDNRVRFQQEHLHKARQELETKQRELLLEQQTTQTEMQRCETLLRLRSNQLDHYRALLDEREMSLRREHELLANSRRAIENDSLRDKDRLRQESKVRDRERQSQQAEIRRQHDLLTLHAESLEGRRIRLDQLRTELEETHRNTLEMRMAAEETWAQLTQTAGDDVAKKRVEEVRAALSENDRSLHEGILHQRQELVEARILLQRQKDEFREERQKLTGLIAQRDDQLRLWQEQVRQEAEVLDRRDAAWRDTRDGWTKEKITAENVIRSLLAQLSELNGEHITGQSAEDFGTGRTLLSDASPEEDPASSTPLQPDGSGLHPVSSPSEQTEMTRNPHV